jgi:DinB superfamily
MTAMYLDALSFLEDERDAWRPYEALLDLTDEQLERPAAGAHGWSGRVLMGHLVAWQLISLDVAKELALREASPTKVRADADWEERGGDVVNAEIDADWAARPIDEVRAEFVRVAGELRGYLTVVPEVRWIKNADHQRFFVDETLDHYEGHRGDLVAILLAARE